MLDRKGLMPGMGFMPGCALSSDAPERVAQTITYLQSLVPDLSVIQMCCGKPTQTMGQVERFTERLALLDTAIKDCAITEMVVPCQSCLTILNEAGLCKATSLWTLLQRRGLPQELQGKASQSDVIFSIHDSCTAREDDAVQDAVRWVLTELGYQIAEPLRTRGQTRCCGFGGAILAVNKKLALRVAKRRVGEFPTPQIVTYCADCRNLMTQGGGTVWHLLDLLWGPVVTTQDVPPKTGLSHPVKAWSNRSITKRKIKTLLQDLSNSSHKQS